MEVRVPSRGVLAVGLATYGLVGLVVALLLALVLGPLGSAGLDGLEAERTALVRLVGASSRTAETARLGLERADDGLAGTAEAAEETASFLVEMGAALDMMAAAMRVDILGAQPFAGAAEEVERAAERARLASEDLGRTAAAARLGAADLEQLGSDLAAVRTELEAVRSGLEAIEISSAAGEGVAGIRLLLVVLLGWLAVPAALSLWLGLRWWRHARERSG